MINEQQPEEMIEVPTLISAVKCGFDSPLMDGYEYEQVPATSVANINLPYIVHAYGNSMEPTILDGDRLVVDHNQKAKDKDIVVAVFNGDYTIKRLHVNNFSTYLRSDNPDINDVKIHSWDTCEILAVAVNLIRKLR